MHRCSKRSLLLALTLGGFAVVPAGCSTSRSSRFYVLTPTHAAAAASTSDGPAIGVGPVVLPGYLDRPQVVTRNSRNELVLREFDRWAEPLTENVSRVLVEDLAGLMSTVHVTALPRRSWAALDFRIAVDVSRFDAGLDGEVVLDARWSITTDRADSPTLIRHAEIRELATGRSPADVVAAMNAALARLSVHIAESIKSLR